MKIISKHKDFYDYIVQDENPDMVYVRTASTTKEDLFDYIPNKPYHYNYFYHYNSSEITINNIVFGVYPYVYFAPYVTIKIQANWGYDYFNYFLTYDDLDNIHTIKDFEKFCKNKAKEYCKTINEFRPLKKYTYYSYYKEKDFGQHILNIYSLKTECKEVFEHIKAPVFCQYVYPITNMSKLIRTFDYHEMNQSKFIINLSFIKLNPDIIRFWIDDLLDINTYNNIENFLWSIKQEPIANPDNNTKIISHGFDLKESFRNIK